MICLHFIRASLSKPHINSTAMHMIGMVVVRPSHQMCGCQFFLVFASSALLFSCKSIRLQLYDFHVILHSVALYYVSCLGLAVTNQNTALLFCILLHSDVQLACDPLHNTVVQSQPRNCSNVTRPFPVQGLGAGNEINGSYEN